MLINHSGQPGQSVFKLFWLSRSIVTNWDAIEFFPLIFLLLVIDHKITGFDETVASVQMVIMQGQHASYTTECKLSLVHIKCSSGMTLLSWRDQKNISNKSGFLTAGGFKWKGLIEKLILIPTLKSVEKKL